jgi:hypothetical protein
MTNLVGRRVESVDEIVQPGDYCGPIRGYTGNELSCFFLLPGSRDEGAVAGLRSVHHVNFPPHRYRECEDGSLEIRESIEMKVISGVA